ncbi:MAG TPA: prephenate dehydratase [Bacteroidota bacterium]|nr:prephenate dehydratase [Bacteroidota bacterium]
MNLPEIRSRIDHLDAQIVGLLHQRMEYALQAGKHKEIVLDAGREEAILRNVTSMSSAMVESGFLRTVFTALIAESRALQEKRLRLVAFQGEHGAWSETAVHEFGSAMVAIPCFEFGDVFAGVEKGEFDFGVVPVENSIEGSVNEVNDLLLETSLQIAGEVVVPIHHNLLALPGSDHREIRAVYSHPQALAQCRAFLSRNRLEPRPFYDTAGAARWLRHEGQKTAGVIASGLAAAIHGLEIVKERIEDHPDNATRFVLLSREPAGGTTDKCTVAFTTRNRVGALLDILRIFAEQKINLTRIESRPSRKDPGLFGFLLDFTGHTDDPAVAAALDNVRSLTVRFKILGFYTGASR